MTHLTAYLSFNGNCAEAMHYYEKALGGRLETLMSGNQSPWKEQMADFGDRILHACLVLDGGAKLYGGDCPPNMPHDGVHGVSMTLDYDTVEHAQEAFAALAAGGKVTMALQPTFWAKTWGMVTDRFGVHWIVNGSRIPL